MFNHVCLKHNDKPLDTDNRQFRITSFASPVSTCCCDDTRVDIIQLITKMVAGDFLPLSGKRRLPQAKAIC